MDANADAAASDISVLEHVVLYGAGEGRVGTVLDTDRSWRSGSCGVTGRRTGTRHASGRAPSP